MYGIVLSRRDFREADQIITILTAEEGMREYLARGVKKIASKNTAHLEPCMLISFGTVEGKNDLSYLTNVQPIEECFSLRTMLSKLHIAGYTIDAVLHTVKEGQDDPALYTMVVSFIRFLNDVEQPRLLLLDGFLIQLFAQLGYRPTLDMCVVCEKLFSDIAKEALSGGAQPYWYFAGGGVACARCGEEKQTIGEKTVRCGIKELHTMIFLLSSTWKEIRGYTIDRSEYRHIHALTYEFVLYHSERTWEDWAKLSSFLA